VACAKCHEFSAGGVGRVSPERCAACHEKEAQLEHGGPQAAAVLGPKAHSDCSVCHAFTKRAGTTTSPDVARDVPKPGDCIRCHAQPLGNTPAVHTHQSAECTKCHRVHESPKPTALACPECHGDVRTTHRARGLDAVHVCTSCHSHPHAEAAVAKASCVGCHFGTEAPHVPPTALLSSGHTECTTCHQPHDFAARQVKPCRSCHGTVQVLGADHVGAHQVCSSCHAPHDVRGSAVAACSNCHRSVHADHPARQGAACTGCHDPHPDAAHSGNIAVPCSNCHQTAASDRAFHEGTPCKGCHAPHDFVLASLQEAPCSSCHRAQVDGTAKRSGHHDCKGCHTALPHHPSQGLASCGQCHAAEAKRANPGHAECRGCHEPHSGALAAPCATCHQKQQASAIPKHPACTTCHEPHAGKQAQPCATCHSAEHDSPHGRLQQGCTNCHRPHGDAGPTPPPPCTSCHQRVALPGLHQEAKHELCTNCHGGHDDPSRAPRELCTRCHTDRTRHFPDAPRCISCHLFTRTR
jgi:hypothetical protein